MLCVMLKKEVGGGQKSSVWRSEGEDYSSYNPNQIVIVGFKRKYFIIRIIIIKNK